MRTLTCLLLSALLWVSTLGLWYRPDASAVLNHGAVSPQAAALAKREVLLFSGRLQRQKLNPEWEMMTRAFAAWSFANLAMRDPSRKAELLPLIDGIIAKTEADERSSGPAAFLLPYGGSMKTSLFVDSELALMMGLRRMVEEDPGLRGPMQARLAAMSSRMAGNALASDASYPNDCWTFDHAVALAAMEVGDRLDGTDHSALIARWLSEAKAHLLDPGTGMLVSDYRLDGTFHDGPEGSSIWLSSVMLLLVDEPFARAQYARAKLHLAHDLAGFSVAREWPRGVGGRLDIDSGIQLPMVEASPSSSGFAIVAAAAFGDRELLAKLLASLEYAGFPERDATGLHYAAGNEMGDVVLLYALVQGPAWDELRLKQPLEEARR